MIPARLLLIAVMLASPALLWGQATTPPPQPPPGTQRIPLQTVRDSSTQDSVRVERVRWPPDDSLRLSIAARPGRAQIKFLAERFEIDNATGRITLYGGANQPAAVKRDSLVLIGDTITYNDSLEILTVRGDSVFVQDPEHISGAGGELSGRGQFVYDLRKRIGRLSELRTTTVEEGETYAIAAREAGVIADTLTNRYSLIGHHGSITTCTDPSPHYHIRLKWFKMVMGRFVVGGPATMYIYDVPVVFLPFMINDMRQGRRSGLLTPRFGFSDIVRNSSSYRRTIENFGAYFALSDYMDAQVWLDWRSGAGATAADPGFTKYAAQLNYKWLNRFLSGNIGASYSRHGDGRSNMAFALDHNQEFSGGKRLAASFNYVTNTAVQRRQEINPFAESATIRSRLNYSQPFGPFQLSAGGTRTQYPGQEQEDQTFPTFSLSSKPLNIIGATFTPNFSFSNSQRFNFERGGQLGIRYFVRPDGVTDSARVRGDSRNTTSSLDMPLTIRGFRLANSFSLTDVEDNFPQIFVVRDVRDTSISETRIYQRTFQTGVDWRTNISLPATILAKTLNITPSFGITNVHPGPYLVRSERSGGEFVAQRKRPQFGVSMSPTLYAFFPGFGPFRQIRHSVAFSASYTYSPATEVSDDYLRAIGQTRQGYLGSLRQSAISLGMNHSFEANLKRDSSMATSAPKLRILTLNLTALSYDFERAKATGGTGLATDNFGITARSDMLPGLDFGANYSLFQGNILSDSAEFKPFLTGIRASFSISGRNNPITHFISIFSGKPTPGSPAAPPALAGSLTTSTTDTQANTTTQQTDINAVSGTNRNRTLNAPAPSELSARLEFTLNRQRPPTGDVIIIENLAELRCQGLIDNAILFDSCVREFEALAIADPNAPYRPPGGEFVRQPTRSSLALFLSAPLTPRWSATWSTNYDFEVGEFATHMVNLSRDMHDWNANFSFTQSPSGSFMFSFLISLKAQPEVKLDYTDQNHSTRGRN